MGAVALNDVIAAADDPLEGFVAAFLSSAHLLDATYGPVCAALRDVASDANATANLIFNILDAHLLAAPVPPDGDSNIALTGYFEPEFDGAIEPDARFPAPIYAIPDDL
ncbi:MAG: MltA domain-containing protein, partial [Pseudomonadota bacterium]